ncbi:MAG: hypothetical protein PHS04_08375 [Tissierellia bacterium]|nr:hypothetical protein [Tissierellia bacterium]
MKTTIVNTLILILIFNLIMIIFPEGKTQKFCRISIKLLIIIFILDNIFLNGRMNVSLPVIADAPAYQREVNVKSISPEIIDTINKKIFQGEEVVSNITLSFTEGMEITAAVGLRKMIGNEELDKLKLNIAEIFQLNSDNIDINGGAYE